MLDQMIQSLKTYFLQLKQDTGGKLNIVLLRFRDRALQTKFDLIR